MCGMSNVCRQHGLVSPRLRKIRPLDCSTTGMIVGSKSRGSLVLKTSAWFENRASISRRLVTGDDHPAAPIHSCGKRYDWVASGETLARWSNQRRHWFSNEYE